MPNDQDTATVERLYRSLTRIRGVEEEIVRIYDSDKVKSPVHLSIGQEAVSVGVCDALEANDIAFGTYRGHALYLAKGGDIHRMAAELFGKVDGCGRGKSGSMHLIDVSVGMMGTSAIVSSSIPHAIGYAHALKARGSDSIVVCFFGDAATEEGVFSESINYAQIKNLPVLFVCENNLYAIFTPLNARQPEESGICERVGSYGLPTRRIEDGDIFAIRDAVAEMSAQIRGQGSGPQFLECMTYRWMQHVGPGEDWDMGYRSKDEMQPWLDNDQIAVLGKTLGDTRRGEIDAEVTAEITTAFSFAEESPFPPAEELLQHVFSNH
jgi:TPP-dependent pyruvate/acetoin dehydrogenase alpha subunit